MQHSGTPIVKIHLAQARGSSGHLNPDRANLITCVATFGRSTLSADPGVVPMPYEALLPTVTAELIDPREAPERYGVDRLISEIRAEDPSMEIDETSADLHADLESFWPRPRPYQVLDDGEGVVLVPILIAAAPDIPSIVVEASLKSSGAAGGSFSFTVAGTGPTADLKLTMESSTSIKASSGEIVRAAIDVPVHWERRAPRDTTDYGVHLVAWPVAGPRVTRVEVVSLDVPAAVERETVYAKRAGAQSVTRSHSLTSEGSVGFKVGFTAAGIDASLGVTAEFSTAFELEASMPSGHDYAIGWMKGPMGLWVEELHSPA
jgi:hypothetical protein